MNLLPSMKPLHLSGLLWRSLGVSPAGHPQERWQISGGSSLRFQATSRTGTSFHLLARSGLKTL